MIRGTISHGTLRAEDLIPVFLCALRHLRKEGNHEPTELEESADNWIDALQFADSPYFDAQNHLEDSHWIIEDLQDALNQYADDGYYFGTSEGDGSDFGFWPCEDYGD